MRRFAVGFTRPTHRDINKLGAGLRGVLAHERLDARHRLGHFVHPSLDPIDPRTLLGDSRRR
jgi:hypothetical protein